MFIGASTGTMMGPGSLNYNSPRPRLLIGEGESARSGEGEYYLKFIKLLFDPRVLKRLSGDLFILVRESDRRGVDLS